MLNSTINNVDQKLGYVKNDTMRDFIIQKIKENFHTLTYRIKPGNTGSIYITKKIFAIETNEVNIPLGIYRCPRTGFTATETQIQKIAIHR